MSLKSRIAEDMKAALRGRDAPRLGAIRLLLAAIKQREVDDRVEIDDAGVIAVVEKMLKQRRDSIQQYEAAGRADLADVEKHECEVITAYMPQPLSEDEIAAAVADAIRTSGAAGPQDMGKVMGLVKPALAGRADMGRVSAMVKAALSKD